MRLSGGSPLPWQPSACDNPPSGLRCQRRSEGCLICFCLLAGYLLLANVDTYSYIFLYVPTYARIFQFPVYTYIFIYYFVCFSYIFLRVYIYSNIFLHIPTCLYMLSKYSYILLYMHIYPYIFICIHIYSHIGVYIYIYIYV